VLPDRCSGIDTVRVVLRWGLKTRCALKQLRNGVVLWPRSIRGTNRLDARQRRRVWRASSARRRRRRVATAASATRGRRVVDMRLALPFAILLFMSGAGLLAHQIQLSILSQELEQ